MQRLIITPGGKTQIVDLTPDEIRQRQKDTIEAEAREQAKLEKEQKKELALQRLKASSEQTVLDLLELVG